ncbi:MAG: PEP-CTERM sorting domain-containing protein [Akkermansiaceae bacterium]
MTGDYLFIPSGAIALGADPVITWTVTGLAANTDHTFTFTPGETTARGVDFASGASSVSMLGGGGDVILTLTSDGSGQITGTATGTGNEGNWAALTIESVPEPSSTALLGLGGLALILRRRK